MQRRLQQFQGINYLFTYLSERRREEVTSQAMKSWDSQCHGGFSRRLECPFQFCPFPSHFYKKSVLLLHFVRLFIVIQYQNITFNVIFPISQHINIHIRTIFTKCSTFLRDFTYLSLINIVFLNYRNASSILVFLYVTFPKVVPFWIHLSPN